MTLRNEGTAVVCDSQCLLPDDRDRQLLMTISGFIDESGKFKDHRIICIGCVAAFNQHVDEFAHEWGRLLHIHGMENFHTTKALKHHVPLGKKADALGVEKRIQALLPFIACIRKYLAVATGIWIDAKAFKQLPSHFFPVFGRDPSYMAFMRTILQVADFTPPRDRIVLACDEDEQTASEFYALYRRAKQVIPALRKQFAAISFCDDTAVFAIQAADLVASMVRLDAIARRDRQKQEYRPLFQALVADPERYERIWFCGIAKGDKATLQILAAQIAEDLKKRKLII